jgi:hypothetical protein
MTLNPKKLSRWIERKGEAYLEWDERRSKARLDKNLREQKTYWILLALCAAMICFGFWDHANVIIIRSWCLMALSVVFLKCIQLTLIALRENGFIDK